MNLCAGTHPSFTPPRKRVNLHMEDLPRVIDGVIEKGLVRLVVASYYTVSSSTRTRCDHTIHQKYYCCVMLKMVVVWGW